MPHDRVYKKDKNSTEWTEQASVQFTDENGNENLTEVRTAINDPLIVEYL